MQKYNYYSFTTFNYFVNIKRVIIMELWMVNLTGNILEIIILNLFLSACCERKFPAKKHYLLCIPVLLLLFTGTTLFIAQSTFIIISSIISNLAMTLLYKCKWYMRFLYAVSIWLIIALTEIIVSVLFNFYGIATSLTQQDPLLFAIGTIISKIFGLITVCIVRLFIKKRQYTAKNVLLILPLPLSSVLVLAMLMPTFYNSSNVLLHTGILTSSALLIVANMSVFYFLDKQDDYIASKAKLMFAESHIEEQKAHYKELYANLNETRIFRHDIKNQMLSLMGLMRSNETEKALQAMQTSLDMLDKNGKNIIDSGNPVIDAVLQSKLTDAQNKNVQMLTSIKIQYDINVDEIEFGILLGNIVDNAIEASRQVQENLRAPIKLSIIATQGNISVNVTNSTIGNIDTSKLETNKSDKANHGYGIKTIKSIAEKYGGIAYFECNDNIFTTRVNISNIAV